MDAIPTLDVLMAAVDFHLKRAPVPTSALPYAADAICEKMEKLAAESVMDYGVSARTGWPTAKGVAHLREHAPEWSADPERAAFLDEHDF